MPPAPHPVRRRGRILTPCTGDSLEVADVLAGLLPRAGEWAFSLVSKKFFGNTFRGTNKTALQHVKMHPKVYGIHNQVLARYGDVELTYHRPSE